MAAFKHLVLSNPVPGRDEDFNHWYDEQHIPDVMHIPGYLAHQRLRTVDRPSDTGFVWGYAALYDVDVDHPRTILAEIGARRGTPAMRSTDAVDYRTMSVSFLEALTEASGDVADATHRIFLFSNALPGREAEHEQWLRATQVRALGGAPGVVGAQAFRQVFAADPAKAPWIYLTMVDVKGDAQAVRAAVQALPASPAADPAQDEVRLLAALTGVVRNPLLAEARS